MATGLSQPLARFAVGGMGNGAGVKDVDISLTDTCNQFVSGLNESPRQELCLRLV